MGGSIVEDVVPRGSVKKRCALWGRLIMVCLLGVALIMCNMASANAAPSGEEIAAKVTEKIKGVAALQADIASEFSDPSSKSPTRMTIRVSGDKGSGITRMEITQHPVFEGQIIIVDVKKDLTTVYMPVTGQAYRGKSATMATQLGFDVGAFDLEKLLSLDLSAMVKCSYLRQEKVDRLPHYVLETRVVQSPQEYQIVWVDCETYTIKRVEAYNSQGKRVATIIINNLKLDTKIDSNKLRELPKGTRITEIK
jgi:outer membrane lipoprotein-sorting protein